MDLFLLHKYECGPVGSGCQVLGVRISSNVCKCFELRYVVSMVLMFTSGESRGKGAAQSEEEG